VEEVEVVKMMVMELVVVVQEDIEIHFQQKLQVVMEVQRQV
jgi:hypothetical protein